MVHTLQMYIYISLYYILLYYVHLHYGCAIHVHEMTLHTYSCMKESKSPIVGGSFKATDMYKLGFV